uniref:Uncharacterized protein n=1 Tax=Anopheles maculatus TaxID=74869 RepID=A0A182T0F2_9DIPT
MQEELDTEEEADEEDIKARVDHTSAWLENSDMQWDKRERSKDVDLAKLSSTRYASVLNNNEISGRRAEIQSRNDISVAPEEAAKQHATVQVRKVNIPSQAQIAATSFRW